MRIRYARDRRIAVPDQAAFGFVNGRHRVTEQRYAGCHIDAGRQIADSGKGLRELDSRSSHEAPHGSKNRLLHGGLRTRALSNRRWAILDRVIDELVGDLVHRLVPADAFPLAFATLADALHRVQQALLAVHVLRVPQAFLAAAWAVIRHVIA